MLKPFIVLACAAVLHGCSIAPSPSQFFPQEDGPGLESIQAEVRALLENERPLAAAKRLWRVSESYRPPVRGDLRLQAIAILFDNQHEINARFFLSRFDESDLDGDRLLTKRLFDAHFLVQTRRPEKIPPLLPTTLVRSAPPDLQLQAWRLLAPAAAQAGDIVLSMQSYTEIDRMVDDAERADNILQLWDSLSRTTPAVAKAGLGGLGAPLDDRVRAWLNLALIATPERVDTAALEAALTEWRQQNDWVVLPDSVIEKIRRRWEHLDFTPENIALLLPLTGAYKEYGLAVQEGFMEAFGSTGTPTFTIKPYNTDAEKADIAAVYKTAVDEGADLVVGPLIAEHVTQLINERVIAIPTLSLNYYRGRGHIPIRDYVQFGLLPEDEAVQVARRMWDDNLHAAVLLVPDEDWGARLADAFAEEYLALGGVIQETLRYNPDFVDYSANIKSVLRLDESASRAETVKNAVGRELRFTPHIRRDIQAAALFADAPRAALLYPQLKYYYSESLPVYASSHIYDPLRKIRRELDGIFYCDAPAILHPTEKKEHARLHALGHDAFHMIGPFRLMQLVDTPFRGRTGDLSLTNGSRIFRKLQWARFAQSRPVPLRHAN